jgi:DNA-binding NarL/FixJ family response regulator
MIRVVVADDQALVRLGLRVLLETEDDIEQVGEAADGRETIEVVRRTRPDIAVVDVRMPELDGIAALRAILVDPDLEGVRVIVLTTFELDDYVFDALQAGASAFLTKDTEPAELLRALRVVAGGESLLSPTVTRRVIREFVGRRARRPASWSPPRIDALTSREREIVSWVAEGLSNEEIAERFVVSPATVRTHVSRAMVKLHARDRAQLVVFAYQAGLASTGS